MYEYLHKTDVYPVLHMRVSHLFHSVIEPYTFLEPHWCRVPGRVMVWGLVNRIYY